MTDIEIPEEYYGWWRILETSQWTNDGLDELGTALLSITGDDDRLRMLSLLAYVNCKTHQNRRIVYLGGRVGV